jgi:hypothetical protein
MLDMSDGRCVIPGRGSSGNLRVWETSADFSRVGPIEQPSAIWDSRRNKSEGVWSVFYLCRQHKNTLWRTADRWRFEKIVATMQSYARL